MTSPCSPWSSVALCGGESASSLLRHSHAVMARPPHLWRRNHLVHVNRRVLEAQVLRARACLEPKPGLSAFFVCVTTSLSPDILLMRTGPRTELPREAPHPRHLNISKVINQACKQERNYNLLSYFDNHSFITTKQRKTCSHLLFLYV